MKNFQLDIAIITLFFVFFHDRHTPRNPPFCFLYIVYMYYLLTSNIDPRSPGKKRKNKKIIDNETLQKPFVLASWLAALAPPTRAHCKINKARRTTFANA